MENINEKEEKINELFNTDVETTREKQAWLNEKKEELKIWKDNYSRLTEEVVNAKIAYAIKGQEFLKFRDEYEKWIKECMEHLLGE